MTEAMDAGQQDAKYLLLLSTLMPIFEENYDESLPYHNWQHAAATAYEALLIRRKLTAADRQDLPSHFALVTAGWGHDMGMMEYYQSHQSLEGHEAFASTRTQDVLSDFHVNDRTVEEVGAMIMATSSIIKCKTMGDSILRAADLQNIAGDYDEDFIASMKLLCLEHERLKGKSITVIDYADMAIKVLVRLLDRSFDFKDPKEAGYPFDFKTRALANIRRFAIEVARDRGEKSIDYVHGLGSTVLRVLQPGNPD